MYDHQLIFTLTWTYVSTAGMLSLIPLVFLAKVSKDFRKLIDGRPTEILIAFYAVVFSNFVAWLVVCIVDIIRFSLQ